MDFPEKNIYFCKNRFYWTWCKIFATKRKVCDISYFEECIRNDVDETWLPNDTLITYFTLLQHYLLLICQS